MGRAGSGGGEASALWRTAALLSRRAAWARGARTPLAELAAIGRRTGPSGAAWPPPLLLFTDPQRTPDVLAAAAALPRGAGVVLRTFGRPEVEAQAPALAALCRARGLLLLVGADAALARRIGAGGVHLPERLAHGAGRLRRGGLRVTAAAHSAAALRRAAWMGAEAAVLSPVFPSASPSAGQPLGVLRAAQLIRRAGLPVYALGGVTAATAPRLGRSGAAGLAAVAALAAAPAAPGTARGLPSAAASPKPRR